jgi:hypothetical protein
MTSDVVTVYAWEPYLVGLDLGWSSSKLQRGAAEDGLRGVWIRDRGGVERRRGKRKSSENNVQSNALFGETLSGLHLGVLRTSLSSSRCSEDTSLKGFNMTSESSASRNQASVLVCVKIAMTNSRGTLEYNTAGVHSHKCQELDPAKIIN